MRESAMNESKQVCKNIATGKYFLFIEEIDEKLLLVIPTGEVKPLDASLFEDIEEVNITNLLNNCLITQQQLDGYKKFLEEDSLGLFQEIMESVPVKDDEDGMIEIFNTAQERMSKEQYKFVSNCLTDRVLREKRKQNKESMGQAENGACR